MTIARCTVRFTFAAHPPSRRVKPLPPGVSSANTAEIKRGRREGLQEGETVDVNALAPVVAGTLATTFVSEVFVIEAMIPNESGRAAEVAYAAQGGGKLKVTQEPTEKLSATVVGS
jgi:hypothetical protein